MVRIVLSRSTIVAVRDTAIGIDWRFTYSLPAIHLPTNLVNSRFNALHCLLTFIFNYLVFLFLYNSTFTMRRLFFFLVFATIGATNTVEGFDEWDFKRRHDTLGIVNG